MVAYGNFVKALVERYDGDGIDDMPNLQYGIKYWEILNEPEHISEEHIFFMGYPGQDSAEAYVEILVSSEAKIKAADSDAKVVIAGAAGFETPTDTFFGTVFSSASFDIANTHSVNAGETLVVDGYKTLLADNNINKHIWITEISYTIGDGGQTDQGQAYVSEEAQAKMLVRSFVYAFGQGIEKIFCASPVVNSNSPEKLKDRALIDVNGTKRPGYYALTTLVNKIDHFNTVEVIATNQYKFNLPGKYVYVLWGTGNFPSEISGEVIVTDVIGNISTKDASQISLSESPIYIER